MVPEPVSIAVMSGGLIGLMIRFLRRGFDQVKRAFDMIGAGVLLALVALIIGLLALLVKLTSRGPAFFTQVRVGKDGRLFNMIKLRTMRQNAEHASGPVWASKHDQRITPLGQFLRLTHLDELPQLWNVLRGDMSLVGPRPERPFFVNQFRRNIPHYEKRLSVRPGITGLAQVKHKYDETIDDVEKKLAYDLTYIHHMGWGLELKILVWTLGTLTGRGAR